MSKAKSLWASCHYLSNPTVDKPTRGYNFSPGVQATPFSSPKMKRSISLKDTKTSNAVVRMRFVGGTNSGIAQPVDALSTTSNYLIGNDPSKWLTDVAQYTKLRYENVYPGIDVRLSGRTPATAL